MSACQNEALETNESTWEVKEMQVLRLKAELFVVCDINLNEVYVSHVESDV